MADGTREAPGPSNSTRSSDVERAFQAAGPYGHSASRLVTDRNQRLVHDVDGCLLHVASDALEARGCLPDADDGEDLRLLCHDQMMT